MKIVNFITHSKLESALGGKKDYITVRILPEDFERFRISFPGSGMRPTDNAVLMFSLNKDLVDYKYNGKSQTLPKRVKEGAFVGLIDKAREWTFQTVFVQSLKQARGLGSNPPFYAHNLYEKKTHGLNLKQMRRLYAMVSRGNQKAITYARNVLGIPFSESPTQVKAVVYHHVRDLAERRVRRNPARSHRERIAIDTVRHPMKGYFLGGPDLAESVRYLRSLGYTMAQLKKLNPEVEDILEGRKSILPNRRVRRNPFGGETLRSFKQKYKGFEIIVEIQPNTVFATWTNGDILESDRFSGYELDEIFEEVKARIDALKRRRK